MDHNNFTQNYDGIHDLTDSSSTDGSINNVNSINSSISSIEKSSEIMLGFYC
jgi:hypothetical protein